MNSDNLILRQTDFPPLVNKNDFIDSSEFDANFTNIYEDLVALCVTSGVLNFDVDTEYDDAVNQFAMHDGRLYRFIFATPTSNVTPGTESSEAYWLEIFPTDLAHRKNSDTILAEGTASQVTAAEIRAFIDAGLTSTTNLSITEHTSTTFKLNSSTGADVVIPQATPTEAGLLNSEDKVKLQQLSGENSGDQTLESLGAEAEENKVDNLDSPNATTYPTTNAVSTALSAAKSDIIAAAPANLNTLEELANAINNDPVFSETIQTGLDGKEASLPSMVGNALKVLRVNAGATAKEWAAISTDIQVGTTPITSGTDGRVLFEGAGNVVQEDSALFWDNTNKRLGVGATPSSSVRLDVRAQGALSTDIAFRVRNSADNANIISASGNGLFTLGNTSGYHIGLNPSSPTLRGYNGAAIAWQLSPWTGENSFISGSLGLGITNPLERLHVYTAAADTAIKIGTGAATVANETACLKFSTTFAGTSFGGDALVIRARSKGTNSGDQKCSAEFSLNRNGTNALRASITSQSNLLLQAPTEDTNDVGVIYIPNGTAPTANLAGGGKLYVEGGELKYRGSSGTVTVLGVA